ncbi:MAG: hypothetical protein V4638_07055 [Bacteroidota bacterium]
MQRIFSILFIAVFVLGCKKNKTTEVIESQISYEINGVPVQLTSKTDLTFTFSGAIQTTGEEIPTNILFLKTPQMLLKVRDFTNSNPITIGIYAGKTYDGFGNVKGVEFSYTDNVSTFYESSFQNPVTEVNIQSISRDGVKGTFRAWAIHNQDTLKFENGSFSIHTYKN